MSGRESRMKPAYFGHVHDAYSLARILDRTPQGTLHLFQRNQAKTPGAFACSGNPLRQPVQR
jgi:hypothetical protein